MGYRICRHDKPTEWKLRHTLNLARRLVKESPDGPNSGYQRGVIDGLSWALGQNATFDRQAKKARRKKSTASF